MSVESLRDALETAIGNLTSLSQFGAFAPRGARIEEAVSALEMARASLAARASGTLDDVAFVPPDAPESERAKRHVRVVAHMATVWLAYDQTLAALGELHVYDFDKPATFGSFLKCDKKQPIAWSTGEIVVRYRASASTAYAWRNLLLHGGASAKQRAVVQHVSRYGLATKLAHIPDGESTLAEMCTSYGATLSELSAAGSGGGPIGVSSSSSRAATA